MWSRLSHTRLLRSAGLYTWALVGIPIVGNAWFLPPSSGVDEQGINVPMAMLAYLVFGICYWLATRSLAGTTRSLSTSVWDIPLLVVLTSAALAVGLYTKTGLGALLMLIVAGVLPWLLAVRVAVAWLVVAHVFLVPS
ncbi:MAG: sensor histidine kinase, partial [Lysobacteraceae bacterium]